MPTGGSAATSPANPAAAAPDPSVIVAAVQADLDQLQAVARVAELRQTVATAQTNANAAAAALTASHHIQDHAGQGVTSANDNVSSANGKLSSIAVAAYTGAAYNNPAAAPSSDPGQAPGSLDLSGTLRSDADEMMSLITVQENRNLNAAKKAVTDAKNVLSGAAGNVARTQASADNAMRNLASARTDLAQTMRGATVAGAAATTDPGGTVAPTTTTLPKAGSAGSPTTTAGATGNQGPQILGPPTVSAAELAGWFQSTKHRANATIPMTQMAVDYLAAGKVTGVRGDLAFAQSIIETGYFSFPAGGQLVATDNNFAGIGACDSCAHGWSFPNPITGVTAQEELLEAYASPTQVPTPLVGSVGVGGCCPTWTALAGKWATDPSYGISILTVYKAMLDYAIPEELVHAGLAPPGSAPPLPAVPAAPGSPTLPTTLPATGPATTAAPKAPTLAPTSP